MDYLEERVSRIEEDLTFIKKMLMELTSGVKEAFIEFSAQIDSELNDIKSDLRESTITLQNSKENSNGRNNK